MFTAVADSKNPHSLAAQSRVKRFQFFVRLLETVPRPLKILDIGGTQQFWKDMGFTQHRGIEIHLLNLYHQTVEYPNFTSLQGNATNLNGIGDKFYDIVFSNSVIEHLFCWENQVKMASEIRRTGKNYFIQTPDYTFPIEPHFVFPFFHYLPQAVRLALITNFKLGHFPKFTDKKQALEQIREINLLNTKEMKKLFPEAAIYFDTFLGLHKSIVAYHFENR